MLCDYDTGIEYRKVFIMKLRFKYQIPNKGRAMETDKTYGCEDCKYYSKNRCKLWEVKVSEPDNQSCESLAIKQ